MCRVTFDIDFAWVKTSYPIPEFALTVLFKGRNIIIHQENHQRLQQKNDMLVQFSYHKLALSQRWILKYTLNDKMIATSSEYGFTKFRDNVIQSSHVPPQIKQNMSLDAIVFENPRKYLRIHVIQDRHLLRFAPLGYCESN